MKNIVNAYNKLEKTVAGLVLLVLILAGGLQVLFRYLFHSPLAWAEELIIFCSVWSVYLGASSAANEGKHIMVAMFVDRLPRVPRLCVNLVSQLIWLACSVGLAVTGYISLHSVFLRQTRTVGGKFPYWIAMAAVPVGMALMSLRVAAGIVRTIRAGGEAPAAESGKEGLER